jgi:hypothetical protein
MDLLFNTPNGEELVTVQGCVSLLGCGYTGNPITVTPTGTPVPQATSGETQIDFVHPVDSARMVLQSTPGQSGTVSNITASVEGNFSCVAFDLDGTFTFNILVDTTGLPIAQKDDLTCYPPIQPILRLEAPAGVFLNRKVGGSPVANAWQGGTESDGSVYVEQYPAPDLLQNFEQYVQGGTFSADFIGTGRIKVCYEHRYLTPVAAVTTVSGSIQELCDPGGSIPVNTPVTLL